MRKVVSGLFITLDGVTDNPGKWQETFDEDMAEELGASMEGVDAILMGRVTYQEWAPYWPTIPDSHPDGGYARYINTMPKYVVSKTLKSVEWGNFNNAHLLSGDLATEVGQLKQQAGGTIAVQGSPTLVNSLLQADLLDELTLVIHNVATYEGSRLFGSGNLKRFNLTRSRMTRSGVAILSYQPR